MRPAYRIHSYVLLIACTIFWVPASAVSLPAFDLPQIGSIDVPKTAKAGDTVQIVVKAAKEGTSACGMVLNFGDGSDQQFKINIGDAKLPVSVEHVYKKAGKYTVQANGRKITTHQGCKASASAAIQITPVKKAGKGSAPKN